MKRPSWLFLLVSSLSSFAQADEFDEAIRSYMDNQYIRGSSVAFYDGSNVNGVTEFARGYGKVSSSNSAKSVTADTAFMLASVGKVFAASAVAAMLDQELISSLDEDICETTSSWGGKDACRHPDFPTTPVTWRMLVTHRSSLIEGLPLVRIGGVDYEASYGPAGYESYDGEQSFGNPTCPLDDAQGFYQALFMDKPSLTTVGGGNIDWYTESDGGWQQGIKPGSTFSYSNFAFGYIAALVELKTGKSFEEFSHESLFQPLGMTRTSWFRESLPAGTETAVPVYDDGFDYQDVGHYCFIDFASGQLYSTANDMANFLKAMLDRGVNDLWSNAIGDQLFSCQEEDASGQMVEDCTSGIGWELIDNTKKQSLPNYARWLENFKTYDWTGGAMHAGSEYGITSQILVLPASKVYIAVMTNTDDAPAEGLAGRVGWEASETNPQGPNQPKGCFSGNTLVQVQSKGFVRMDELKIGDMVLSKDGTYTKVYSFAHLDRYTSKEFLQIKMSGQHAPLELTADHMVYVDNKVGLLPAGQIKPGDTLVTSEQKAFQAEVISVRKVERKGIYAPITVSGNIVVNGIASSNFISLSSVFQSHLSFKDQHWLQYVSYGFYHISCGWIGCDGETYDEAYGLSQAVLFWLPVLHWFEERGQMLVPVLVLFVTVTRLCVQNAIYLVAVALGYMFWIKSGTRAPLGTNLLHKLTNKSNNRPIKATTGT